VDDSSRLSTRRVGATQEQVSKLYIRFQMQPTVDAFASSSNAVCQKFFSMAPQKGGQAVDFLAQQLGQDKVPLRHTCERSWPHAQEVAQALRSDCPREPASAADQSISL
jgi:hypothetical protein